MDKIKNISPSDYTLLLNRVKKTLIEGQQKIEEERVRIYWETGRHIYRHILKYSDRADYGTEVYKRLEKDLSVDLSVLQRCVQFVKAYPRLPNSAGQRNFSWSHYVKLITVSDNKKRLSLEKAVIEKHWSADELALRIKNEESETNARSTHNEVRSTIEKPLTPLRGELFTYQIIKRPIVGTTESELLLDLGFGIFRQLEARQLVTFKDGDIVQSTPKEDAYKFSKTDLTAKALYTYAAYVEKVIDADTLKVRLDLGFDTWVRQTLRLRDLDAAELGTSLGDKAKVFVQSYIKEADRIVIRSSRSDKYDRYLADIFIPTANNEAQSANDEIYLNNLLLEQGYAVRMG